MRSRSTSRPRRPIGSSSWAAIVIGSTSAAPRPVACTMPASPSPTSRSTTSCADRSIPTSIRICCCGATPASSRRAWRAISSLPSKPRSQARRRMVAARASRSSPPSLTAMIRCRSSPPARCWPSPTPSWSYLPRAGSSSGRCRRPRAACGWSPRTPTPSASIARAARRRSSSSSPTKTSTRWCRR